MTKKSKLKATAAVAAALDAFVDPPWSEVDFGDPVKTKRKAKKKPKRGKIKLPHGTVRRSRHSRRASSLFHLPGRGPALLVDGRATLNSVPTANDNALPAEGADRPANDPAANENMGGAAEDAHSTGKAISVVVRRHSLAVAMPVDGEDTWESLAAEFFAWNEKSVESVIGQGVVILKGRAKDNPEGRPHGQFGPWVVEKLRLGKNKKSALWIAGMFMQIPQHPVIRDRRYWRFLPGAYRTLWELTHLPEEVLLRLINEGRVHHNLSRREAERLKKEVLGGEPSDGDTSDHGLSNEEPKLPVPPIPREVAVLLKVIRYFIADKIIRAYLGVNEGVSEFPSYSELDAAVQEVKEKHSRMRGER